MQGAKSDGWIMIDRGVTCYGVELAGATAKRVGIARRKVKNYGWPVNLVDLLRGPILLCPSRKKGLDDGQIKVGRLVLPLFRRIKANQRRQF